MDNQSFKYYLENTFDSTRVELFKQHFKDRLELLPDKVCSFRVIYNICLQNVEENTQYKQSILNNVWTDYFKLKITGKLGECKVNNKKIESKSNHLPIR